MKKAKGFTMIEIMIIVLVISLGMFSVLATANHAKLVNQRITQTIIANQIATEGAEIMYQTRNTNFLKYENGKKNGNPTDRINKCRLALDYENCNTIEISSTNFTMLNTGLYYITNENGLNTITGCNDEGCESKIDNRYAICLNSGSWVPCPEGHEDGGDESKDGKFFRRIEGIGIYNMAVDTTGGTQITKKSELNGKQAQEYRFCSRVYRIGGQQGEVEICGTMTNFIE